ncbi:ATP-binding protein [Flavobacterium sp. HBTb2-11-1]|uniref:tetratricopeptide repeat-containing sensor histidine kinase n=1 Tax=Flavobacterium sp. HBTb2-11-1 TaxID=2692212 RepID=UPI00192839BE|nr:ATP-binding protein [Flavobacterium sp. HBTb2-11-1]
MIPKRIQLVTPIIALLLVLFSCHKDINDNLKELNNKLEIQKNIDKAAVFYHNYNDTDSSFFYYNKAKLLCDPKKDPDSYVSILNCMADIQLNHGDHIGSETTITDAIPYLKSIKDQTNVWNTYTTLGTNYLRTYNLNDALLYYNKALGLKVDESRKSLTKSDIASVLLEQQKYNEALQIFLRLSTKKELQQKPEYNAKNIDNIGICYNKMSDPRGIQYLNQALQIREEIKNKSGVGISNLHIASYYDENKARTLAKKHALEAYKKFSEIDNIDNKLSSLKLLIKNNSDQELKKYSILYIDLVDSIFEVRQKAKNQFARIKYDSKREKEENLKLKTHKAENELKLERQKSRNIISYIIIILSLCLILILYYYLTSKANREKIEAAYNSETRISKKLHDELANDIYHTMAFAENRNLSLAENREQLLHNLDTIYARTRDISKENAIILTDENYISSLKEMISRFNTPNINLLINGLDTISWDEVDKVKKTAIYRAIQELLVNMKKHSDASLVAIIFKESKRDIIINYTDNGKGIDLNKMILKNGLHNIENRILAIKGAIDIDSGLGKGFKLFIKLPI